MKRKKFIQQIGATALIASMGISLESCTYDTVETVTPTNPNTPTTPNPTNGISVDLDDNMFSALSVEDSWLLHPSENILIANVNGQFLAFSSSCPHSGCTRDWVDFDGKYQCNCHGSRFNLNGSLDRGPATSGLTQLTVTQQGQTIIIS